MAGTGHHKRGSFAAAALLAGCSYYALGYTGPLFIGQEINLTAAAGWTVLAISGTAAIGLFLERLSRTLEWFDANRPKGLKGTSDWVKSLREIRDDLVVDGWGPFWGAFKGKPLIIDHESNALVVGPAGAGKGVTDLQPNVLSIHENKIVLDFKGENACVLADALRRRGEVVRIVNLGDLFPDILGESDGYNILGLLADNFLRLGGLMDISDDAHELNMQLLPEPKASSGNEDNTYFRDGSRTDIAFAVIFSIVTLGTSASLADVDSLVSDRKELLRNAQWVAGLLPQGPSGDHFAQLDFDALEWTNRHDPQDVKNFISYFRELATKVARHLENDQSNAADAFLNGAQQALMRFNKATRASSKTNFSTFRFSDLKNPGQTTTVFIIIDASRLEAQAPVVGLLIWGMLTELKRHANKHKPVYVLADEITNFKISGLISGLTWFRGYGIRLRLYLQNLPAFVAAYGQEALKTLLSETVHKLFLPGQRDRETIRLIRDMLADRAIITRGRRGSRDKGFFNIDGVDYRESEVPLMTEDEIRRTDKAILFVGRNKPMLVDPIKIAEIEPFRDQIDINPFHGKPFRLPVKLRLDPSCKSWWKKIAKHCGWN